MCHWLDADLHQTSKFHVESFVAADIATLEWNTQSIYTVITSEYLTAAKWYQVLKDGAHADDDLYGVLELYASKNKDHPFK